MRDCGVEVVEKHELLAETLDKPEAKKWILDQQIVAEEVGQGLVSEIRGYLEVWTQGAGRVPDRRPVLRVTSTRTKSDLLKLAHEATGMTEYLLPPLPNTIYTRDTTCWIYGGVTLNPLYWPARQDETLLTAAIYKFHPDFVGQSECVVGRPDEDHGAGHPRGRRRAWPIGNGWSSSA